MCWVFLCILERRLEFSQKPNISLKFIKPKAIFPSVLTDVGTLSQDELLQYIVRVGASDHHHAGALRAPSGHAPRPSLVVIES